jgi:hypothetical protein
MCVIIQHIHEIQQERLADKRISYASVKRGMYPVWMEILSPN